MSSKAAMIANNLFKEGKDVVKALPFDDLILYSLERRHLDVPAYADILLSDPEADGAPRLVDHLIENVRLFQLDEIAFDADEKLHLPGVESVLSSMRGQGLSLLFIVPSVEKRFTGRTSLYHKGPACSSDI